MAYSITTDKDTYYVNDDEFIDKIRELEVAGEKISGAERMGKQKEKIKQ